MPQRVRIRRRAHAEPSRVRLAQKRRKRRIILFSLLGLVVLSIVPALAYISHLPALTIQNIEIRGAYDTPTTLLQTFIASDLDDGKLHFFSPRNELLYPKARLESDIRATFPKLATVTLSLSSLWHPTLIVNLTERQPDALWCTDDMSTCYYMDSTGYVFEKADAFAEYIVYKGDIATSTDPLAQTYLPQHYSSIRALVTALSQAGFDTKTFTAQNATDYSIILTNGLEVRGSFAQSNEEIISDLQAAMSSDALQGKEDQLLYVDLRFSGRVYFKFK